jgi:Cd2+/Zn2+-exporting ATPase
VENVQETAGYGVSATVDGVQVQAGNRRMMESLGLDAPQVAGTAVYVAADGQLLGHITLADLPKDGAKEAIAALKTAGVSRTVMLTGDSADAAAPVAQALKLDDCLAGLLPQDKVEQVERLLEGKKAGRTLCFVGDGVNDAPVLSVAQVGVAMGGVGSDAAVEASDLVLLKDDLLGLPKALKIARRTISIARQNIAFALIVKFGVMLLSIPGIANMWMAVFADVGVAMICILNSFRAMKSDV